MHEAAQRGESLQLQQLINSGACVNQVTVDSITPLHAASLQGQAQCVQLLLAAGAQVGDHLALTATQWQLWGLVGQTQENPREKTVRCARMWIDRLLRVLKAVGGGEMVAVDQSRFMDGALLAKWFSIAVL